MPATEAFCPECGAALSHATGAEGSDSAVYPELARANLLRMRGDYKAAEDECLKILRRYPNNTTANILLGDICAEKGDLEQSMQWYEMALDLAPESQAAQHKLESVRQRFKEKETVQTVEQLGLPTTKSKAGIYALALIASIFVIAVVAYFLGQRVEQKRSVNLPTVTARGTDSGSDGGGGGGGGGPNFRDDAALTSSIKQSGAEGARLLQAFQDPRSHSIVLAYSVLEGEDARLIGGSIAQQAFKAAPEAPVVTVRAARKGETVFVADVMRAKYEETLTTTWQSQHRADPDSWIDHVLENEWPDKAAKPAPTTGETSGEVIPVVDPPETKPEVTEPHKEEPPKTEPEKPAENKANEQGEPPKEEGGEGQTEGPPGDDVL